MIKRFLSLILCMIALFALSSTAASAASEIKIQNVELTVQFRYDDNTALTGTVFDLYKVADLTSDGKLNLTSTFAAYSLALDINDSSNWPELAVELASYADRDGLAPLQTSKIGADGTTSFPTVGRSLKTGVYLLVAHPHVQGDYTYYGHPLLVSLPSFDEESDAWHYKVLVSPKRERVPFMESDEAVAVHVIVEWIDQGLERYRPSTVNVSLIRDEEILGTETIGPKQNWRHSWYGLHREGELRSVEQCYAATLSSRGSADSLLLSSWLDEEKMHRWSVTQNEVEHYTTTVRREGDTFIITNRINIAPTPSPSPSPTPGKPSQLPQTGVLWWPVLLLGLSGIVIFIIGVYRKQKK